MIKTQHILTASTHIVFLNAENNNKKTHLVSQLANTSELIQVSVRQGKEGKLVVAKITEGNSRKEGCTSLCWRTS